MLTQSLNDYIKQKKKVNNKRNHKIKNSFGVYDAYRWIRKNKWLDIERPLTTKEFYSIIRKINLELAKKLSEGKDVILPCNMGKLEIRKTPKNVKIIDGKIKVNLAIDWNETLKLWYSDEEAQNNKTLLKMEEDEIYKIIYNKRLANYNNQTFYTFLPNRDLKIKLKNNIKQGIVDAFRRY